MLNSSVPQGIKDKQLEGAPVREPDTRTSKHLTAKIGLVPSLRGAPGFESGTGKRAAYESSEGCKIS
jgi:hypothetical protein